MLSRIADQLFQNPILSQELPSHTIRRQFHRLDEALFIKFYFFNASLAMVAIGVA
jgi:hypothetical protein